MTVAGLVLLGERGKPLPRITNDRGDGFDDYGLNLWKSIKKTLPTLSISGARDIPNSP